MIERCVQAINVCFSKVIQHVCNSDLQGWHHPNLLLSFAGDVTLLFRLCFTFRKETEEFVAHVLDPGIWDLRLVEKGKSLMGHKWKDPAAHLQSLTFKALQGRSLQFDPQSLHRPFKRALNFQARQARKYAIRHRWQEASWDFEDFFTEGMDISEKLEKWFGLS